MSPHLEGIRSGEAIVGLLDGTPEQSDLVMAAWRGYLVIRLAQLQVKGMNYAEAVARMQIVEDGAAEQFQRVEANLAEHMRDLVMAAPVATETVQ